MALCNFGHFYLVSKISKKTIGARALNLMSRLVVMSRQPD